MCRDTVSLNKDSQPKTQKDLAREKNPPNKKPKSSQEKQKTKKALKSIDI